MGEILLAIDGPLAAVRDLRPEQLVYEGNARRLPEVWCRVQACLHELLDGVTVADLAAGRRAGQQNMTFPIGFCATVTVARSRRFSRRVVPCGVSPPDASHGRRGETTGGCPRTRLRHARVVVR